MVGKDLGFRKIQRTGRESYIISLPKKWMTSTGLNKGDQLAFKIQEDSSLLLVPRKVIEEKGQLEESSLKEFTVHIAPTDNPQSVSRKIISLYEVGADIIKIGFKEGKLTSEQKTSIKKTVQMLLGSEIIEEFPNKISIQILIDQPKFPIEKAIRRMFAVAKLMDQDAISVLKSLDEGRIHEIINSDYDLDRLNLYVVRQLKYGIEHDLFKEMGFVSPKEFLGYRIVAKDLENVGDHAVGTVKNILSLKKLINDQILTLIKPIDEEVYSSVLNFHSFCHRLLEDSFKALCKRNYLLADEVMLRFMSTGLQLENDNINLLFNKRIDPNVASIMRLIIGNSRKIMEYSKDIAEVTLNRTVEESIL